MEINQLDVVNWIALPFAVIWLYSFVRIRKVLAGKAKSIENETKPESLTNDLSAFKIILFREHKNFSDGHLKVLCDIGLVSFFIASILLVFSVYLGFIA